MLLRSSIPEKNNLRRKKKWLYLNHMKDVSLRSKKFLASYGISSIEEAREDHKDAGLDVYHLIEGIQPICFENAKWAYTVGAAIAIKKGCRKAADAAAAIGEGLQAFCIPGSVADTRKVGLGHGNLRKDAP